MKRDMDKIRELLLAIEGGHYDWEVKSDSEDAHHLRLLRDRDFIDTDSHDMPTVFYGGDEAWDGVRLTWDGSEYLDGVRKESRWNSVKMLLRERGESLSFEAVKMAASMILRQSLDG